MIYSIDTWLWFITEPHDRWWSLPSTFVGKHDDHYSEGHMPDYNYDYHYNHEDIIW